MLAISLYSTYEIGRHAALSNKTKISFEGSIHPTQSTHLSESPSPLTIVNDFQKITTSNDQNNPESSALELDLELLDSKGLKEMALTAMQHVSTDDLIKAASRFSFLSQIELESKDDPKEYIKRLLDVVMFDQDSTEPHKSADDENLADEKDSIEKSAIYFSLEVQPDNRATLPASTFYSNVGAIYATFELSQTQRDDYVIVRWFDVSRNRMISFNRLKTDQKHFGQYVWFYPNQNWPEGEYYVSVYLNNDQISPIADGRFHVARY